MESKLALLASGQSLQTTDVNLIAEEAGLADDRTLFELLRLLPFSATPQKAILAYGKDGWAKESGLTSTALVSGNTADATIRVMPFRAVIGSTDNSDETEKLRGQRSGYLVGTSTSFSALTISANASVSPRWTLVYAAVTPAAADPTVVRYVKDPTTKVVAGTTVTLTTSVTVTVSTINGTAAATPTRPSLPADASGTYYIALAYIWVPGSFGALSVVNRQYIHESAPVITIHSALGVSALRPIGEANRIGGSVDVAQTDHTQQFRPGCYMPPSMVGGESRLLPLQLSLAPHSATTGSVLDRTTDWRSRLFRWSAMAISGSSQANGMVFDRLGGGGQQVPNALLSLPMSTTASGMGQSFYTTASYPTGQTWAAISNYGGAAVYIDDTILPAIGTANSAIQVYVDSSTGWLMLALSTSGSPGGQILIWVDASSIFPNFATV